MTDWTSPIAYGPFPKPPPPQRRPSVIYHGLVDHIGEEYERLNSVGYSRVNAMAHLTDALADALGCTMALLIASNVSPDALTGAVNRTNTRALARNGVVQRR